MAYFMVTYGEFEITEAYVGKTANDAISKARRMIDRWPEYAPISNESLVDMLTSGEISEFDLVQINAQFQGNDLSIDEARQIYSKHFPA